jgi:hypothetical protein
MNQHDSSQPSDGLVWRKSSRSVTGACVEVARAPSGPVLLRDSKDPDGVVLTFPSRAFSLLIDDVKAGNLDPVG